MANQGYTPPHFPLEDYLAQAKPLGVVAGAVVSGSFQAKDQTYLMDILPKLGPAWVGVTQIPNDYPDAEIAKLGKLGVRAVRFNVFRGRIDSVDDIVALATRCPFGRRLAFGNLCRRRGARPACRQAVEAAAALRRSSRHDRSRRAGAARPGRRRLQGQGDRLRAGQARRAEDAGSHRQEKSERAGVRHRHSLDARARPFEAADIDLVERVLGRELAQKAFWDNPLALYRVKVA